MEKLNSFISLFKSNRRIRIVGISIILIVCFSLLFNIISDEETAPTPTPSPTHFQAPYLPTDNLPITDPQTLEAILTDASEAQTLVASPFMATLTDTLSSTPDPQKATRAALLTRTAETRFAAAATSKAKRYLIASINVSTHINELEYIYLPTNCPDQNGEGCIYVDIKRITFSIENTDSQPHEVRLEIDFLDYPPFFDGIMINHIYWEGVILPGLQQITFDYKCDTCNSEFWFRIGEEYLLNYSYIRLKAVDGIHKR